MDVINYRFLVCSWLCLISCVIQADTIAVKPANKETGDGLTTEETQLLALTNKERAAHQHLHLQPLKMNRVLADVARNHSANMARHHHLSHTIKGKSFAFRIKEAGYPVARAGENVARSRHSLPHVMAMWMKSLEHRKNILNHRFKEIGIGITTTPEGDTYFAQVFGAQKTKGPKKQQRPAETRLP